ncbi:uncharacterized protein PHACADRAFT_172848 [Phanerochaete carnosa HHB-10118-sp]|uniref:Uncharacterized protein n=1 Tax=Phanerochaete carnosa (strain HHB-10118-sp) TaxID=650164 RepID=K5V3L5_PHACS|nr:uncharacterized protein PHACADRAFT_172848 [Phanerochaete carnosa HHB-10118-sp]EKM57171.1 hypothetical protein PHACADRAFT_172848 [Phanerochaete carnosa HHB-10118-sp]
MSGPPPKGNYGAPPKYINDFSKALAGEVRILLQEVGKLRDERRQLQHEISELMAVRAKYSSGGEYTPDWHPGHREATPPPALPPPPPPDPAEPAGPAPPAWRTVHKRVPRQKKPKALPAPAAAPPPPAIEAPPPSNLPSWAQWRPNPMYAPQPQMAAPPMASPAPPRAGLFGSPSPPPK